MISRVSLKAVGVARFLSRSPCVRSLATVAENTIRITFVDTEVGFMIARRLQGPYPTGVLHRETVPLCLLVWVRLFWNVHKRIK
jgi:hypothetical protein